MEESNNSRNKAQEFNEKMKDISQRLELKPTQKIMRIDFKDNMNLGGKLKRDSVFVVKIKDKDGTVQHIVIDKDINKIVTIDEFGKLELSDREKELWKEYIGTKGNQRPDQKGWYDFNQEYILEEYKTKEKEENQRDKKSENKKTKEDKEKIENKKEKEDKSREEIEAAKALNVEEEEIICIVKIEDRETFGQAINKKLEADSYIVVYGNNKTKIMESRKNGSLDLKPVSGLEYSEFNSEILEQLNINKEEKDLKIKAGDLTTIKDEERKCNYVVVRENDSDKGIVVVNTPNKVETYTFDDRDKDTIKELKSSIVYKMDFGDGENGGNEEKERIEEEKKQEQEEREEDEDEGRTPWGDAYARRT